MNLNSKLIKGLIVAACALVVVFIFFRAASIISEEYETVSAEETSVFDTLDTKGFIVRDEIMLYNSGGGTVVSTAKNAQKVNAASQVAITFTSSEAANAYSQVGYLEEELESYKTISEQTAFTNIDITALGNQIYSDFENIEDVIYSGNYSSLSDRKLDYLVDVSRRQISLGASIDCSDIITVLDMNIQQLRSRAVALNTITAGTSGYYVSTIDGYEGRFGSDDLEKITVSDIQSVIDSEPEPIGENIIGKVVEGFYWYLTCKINTIDSNAVKEGSTVYIIVGNTSTEKIKTVVYKVKKENDTDTVLILRSNHINAEMLTSRIVNVRIIKNEYSGLKVPQKALRVIDGNKYCYVRVGNVTKLRYLNVVYSNKDYVLARDGGENYPAAHLKKHDEIILNGRGLGGSG